MPFAIEVDRRLASDELKLLRTRGDDLSRAKDWPGLHAMRQEFRTDQMLWAERWGPMCVIAAAHVGDYQVARELFDEVVAAGFHQPEHFAEDTEAAFAGDAELAGLWADAAGNSQAAPVTLVDWPTITPAAPLNLFQLPPEREDVLRAMIPAPSPTAWETATQLAEWVSARWRHANVHMEVDDAVLCLERVAAGSRFACPEYTLVLSQALNALGIPARKVSLAQDGYHAGVGRGHVVSEAWIDDLGRWVVLDGQNGLYWTDDDGEPLGLPELMALHRGGAEVTGYVKPGEPFTESKARFWFSYFAHGVSTAGTAASGGYIPIFQRLYVRATPRLEKDAGRLYPDLAEIAIGVGESGGQLSLRFAAAHPFARGFEVARAPVAGFEVAGEPVARDFEVAGAPVAGFEVARAPVDDFEVARAPVAGFEVAGEPVDGFEVAGEPVAGFEVAGEPVDGAWVVDSTPGEHVVEVRTRTAYGSLAPQTLRYDIPVDDSCRSHSGKDA